MLDQALISRHLNRCLTETDLPFGTKYRGKVRDTYRLDDGRLILVTTDRLSAFDHILAQPIPFKGQILNGVAAYFFQETASIVQNHVLALPDPNVTIARACVPFPIEFVVRGYLAGHAWRVYEAGGRHLCGTALPEGLREGERLPIPILTPATKEQEGHDEDISPAEIIERGLMGPEFFEEVSAISLALFERGSQLAAGRGLHLVDTKYEFGLDMDGAITLIDEVHTPDSSRYYYTSGYEERLQDGIPQRQLSKEFVREWLLEQGFDGRQEHPPDLPDRFRCEITQRYTELYEALTATRFEPNTHPDPALRVLSSLEAAL